MIMKIDRTFRLPAYLGADDLRILGPRLEPKTERMQHQNTPGLQLGPAADREGRNKRRSQRNNNEPHDKRSPPHRCLPHPHRAVTPRPKRHAVCYSMTESFHSGDCRCPLALTPVPSGPTAALHQSTPAAVPK